MKHEIFMGMKNIHIEKERVTSKAETLHEASFQTKLRSYKTKTFAF